MTTTLPFTAYERAFSIDGQLVYVDTVAHKTWFSSDGVTWNAVNWIGAVYPSGVRSFLNGSIYFWETDYDPGIIYSFKSSDFIKWTMQAEQDGFSNFTSDLDVSHSGASIRFNDACEFFSTYSTLDGLTWSTRVETNLIANSAVRKIVSFGGALYAIPYGTAAYKAVYKSTDNGITWVTLTTDWGVTSQYLIDCVSTGEALLAVFADKETWFSVDGIAWTKKNYTLPSGTSVLNNGVILPLGSDLFMVGCGTTQKNVFKLVEASGPVGIPL